MVSQIHSVKPRQAYQNMKDHRHIDERSLAFGTAIAARLQSHPEILNMAKENLERWLNNCSLDLRPTFGEWSALLNGPLDGVIVVLTGRDERSIRLRQSNPFAGAIPPKERNAILLQFKAYDAPRT